MPRSRCQYSYEFRDRYYEEPPATAAATDGPDFRAAAARAKRMRFFKKGSGGGSPSAAVPLTVEAAEAEAVEAVEAAAEGGLSPSKTATLVAGGGDAASGGKGKRRRGGSANGNEEEVLIRAQIDPEVRYFCRTSSDQGSVGLAPNVPSNNRAPFPIRSRRCPRRRRPSCATGRCRACSRRRT